MRLKRAIFLDRDGTLNQDAGYTHRISDWVWLPNAIEGLKKFQDAGWLLVVASNQSGIGRGLYNWQTLKELESWLDRQLALAGVKISGWYYCPHLPADRCACRKPEPGLLLEAAGELGIDLENSWMLGDRQGDIEAGMAAGCSCGLIANSCNDAEIAAGRTRWPSLHVWPDLAAAADAIIALSCPAEFGLQADS